MHEPICTTDKYGRKSWYLNGRRHRTDGPAVEYADGSKEWYLNGIHHRTDGPAIEYADGDKYWYIYNELHRTDGPAIIYADGDKSWYIKDIKYSFDEFVIEMNWTQEEIVIWKLQYA
jgi:hypothetical protein